ncbi:Single-stranded DNA-binding protein 1 [Candidatus Methylobacter favarea]|uniref:Single-stranded DNA-binding protein n=1 Tax=Candidatus Methylobacter favarea TaxID=2707345 RepID=A0A8S0X0S8_9GAMM|nr:single-stranded DNA-binding protein [Candidatus Methylobacter favarea]CAA9890778.1 Single-stranded DNA-binding protein 1 [Candidatus Methylobacter favarea]
MAVLNKVSLIGHFGADPVIRYMPNGTPTVTINLATTETWKDRQSGEKKERTGWHRVVFFNGLAKTVGEYLKSGSQVYVEGKLRNRKWKDSNNVDRYTTEIVVHDLQMLGKAPNAVSAPVVDEPPLSDDFEDDY